MGWTVSFPVFGAVAVLGAAVALVAALSPQAGGYEFTPGPTWTKTEIINGHEYRSAQGQVLTILSFVDPLMDETVLFSPRTRSLIRENYEETYRVEDDHIYFTRITLAGREALVVYFADRRQVPAVHKRQYYLVKDHHVYLLTGTVTEAFGSANFDRLAENFRIR